MHLFSTMICRSAAVAVLWIPMLAPAHAANESVAERWSADSYARNKEVKGVVLLSIRWDRKWKCGGFENAQLRAVGFDQLPRSKATDDLPADIIFDDAPLIATKPTFDDYALIVDPGEYVLSRLQIKVARSVSDVGFLNASRSLLLKGDMADAGTFNVAAGEVVYIGHFYLSCANEPTLWRYYMKDRNAFEEYLAGVKTRQPELNTEQARFRLFKSKAFGSDFALP